MIVILEGCDKTGKSTLAKAFEEKGYRYLHFGAPKPGGPTALEEMSAWLTSQDTLQKISTGTGFVLDRFHLGELVYPPLFGREPSMDAVAFRGVERQLDFLGGFLVHCTDSVDNVRTRYLNCKDEPQQKYDQIPETLELFRQAVEKSHLPGCSYRVGDSIPMLVRAVDMYHDLFSPIARARATADLGGDHDD